MNKKIVFSVLALVAIGAPIGYVMAQKADATQKSASLNSRVQQNDAAQADNDGKQISETLDKTTVASVQNTETTSEQSEAPEPKSERHKIESLEGKTLSISPEQFKVRPVIYEPTIVAEYPHDTGAFTQGLFFANGALYESTGQYKESQLRRVNLRTGKVTKKTDLPDSVFGEGATQVGDNLVSVTWRSGIGYVHDLKNLSLEKNFDYTGEGWGLVYDGEKLIMSDGTQKLRFFDPETFEETGSVDVTFTGQPVRYLNELEFIDGEVWANVWQQDVILRIAPETGIVTGIIDMSKIYPAKERDNPSENVLNGIAFEPNSKRLFVTGKRWPKMYEITVAPRAQNK